MVSFSTANQARLILKMKLSQYAWYNSSITIPSSSDGYSVIVMVDKLDNDVRKVIPPIVLNVEIKTELY